MFQFLKDVRAEMAKVVWPNRNDTVRYTLTVIVFSVAVAAVLGAADYGLRTIVVQDAVCSASDEAHDAMIGLFSNRYTYWKASMRN